MSAPPNNRPSYVTEIRAWIGVGIVMAGQLAMVVWWGATLSSDIRHLQGLMQELKVQMSERYTASDASRDFRGVQTVLSDHESRLRKLETGSTGRRE